VESQTTESKGKLAEKWKLQRGVARGQEKEMRRFEERSWNKCHKVGFQVKARENGQMSYDYRIMAATSSVMAHQFSVRNGMPKHLGHCGQSCYAGRKMKETRLVLHLMCVPLLTSVLATVELHGQTLGKAADSGQLFCQDEVCPPFSIPLLVIHMVFPHREAEESREKETEAAIKMQQLIRGFRTRRQMRFLQFIPSTFSAFQPVFSPE
jgi:hypothetical protein